MFETINGNGTHLFGLSVSAEVFCHLGIDEEEVGNGIDQKLWF